ncbi:class IV adenylate cyclase [Christensenellaceae bacterium OttesenSCG-928-L17]|nr:class IV adenylate cyclase [Christensenellaceae bacterium OttesenSCG-928-L17]
MLEIEIKAKADNHAELVKNLLLRGFCKEHTLRERDTYFNGVDRNFKQTDEALRLRSTEKLASGERHAAITYKGPKIDNVSQTRKEYEVCVGDGPRMQDLLMALGYAPVLTVQKERAYYTRGDITACVDEVEGLGSFVELEIVAEESAASDEAVETLFILLEALGISRAACTRKSYLEMLLHKLGRA